ncbi:hypothetical protein CJU90_0101 [Yarrowia sp. C11]|nr:hypothetical protein CKK34_1512 [Yarrowia sp. E02]KAG5372461.1 hypothetical protein CJU90_0101 [Yarrowia sp. C11]
MWWSKKEDKPVDVQAEQAAKEAINQQAPVTQHTQTQPPQTREQEEQAQLEERAEKSQQAVKDMLSYKQQDSTQRFNTKPEARILSVLIATASFGFLSGFYTGYKRNALRFLAENSHRMPKTVQGWYYYHKNKNYHVLSGGMALGFKYAATMTTCGLAFFGLEAYLDHTRGTIDFFNTLASTMTAGSVYSLWYRLSRQQALNNLRRGAVAGLALGLAQDGLRYARGNDLWYLPNALNHQKKPEEEVMHA